MTIELTQGRNTLFVPAENIIRMESVRTYTVFYEKNGAQHVMCTNLGQVQKRLHANAELQKVFFRVHRSHIINLKEVKMYQNARGGKVVLTNNTAITVAHRRKAELLRVLQKLK